MSIGNRTGQLKYRKRYRTGQFIGLEAGHLQIDGPIKNRLHLTQHAPKEKFCIKAEKVHEKAIAEARKVLKNTKMSDLI